MKGKTRKISFILLFSFLFLFAQGCWGSRETDELAYILAIGIDKGKENIIQVTFQIALPRALGGGGGGGGGGEGGKSTEIVSIEASSLFGALQLANAFVSRDLTFIHNKVVVVSEEIAREGLDKYINPLVRSREIRRNNFLLVTKGKARDFLEKNQSILEKNPSRQFELLLQAKNFTGFMPFATIQQYHSSLKTPGRQPITALVGVNEGKEGKEKEKSFVEKIEREVAYIPGEIPRQGGNKAEVIGLAVFNGGKLVGYLNGAETRFYQMVTGDFQSAIFTFPDPQKAGDSFVLVVELKKGRSPAIKATFPQGRPVIEVNLILEGEIFSIQSGINYKRGQKEADLQKFLEDYISQEVRKVIAKTQKEFKSDIFGFGERTRTYFWTWKDWENFDWLERYPQAEIKVNTRVEIRRTGLMLKTEPVESYTGGGQNE
ncbi:MAG: gerBC1 [Peptococcaceae bacterium]|jgi:spore germination protein KC|nr:gerBC1 [Peptococcaceae bacterium]